MYDITEDDLKNLIDSLTPVEQPIVLLAGKGFVRDFAKQWFGGSYSFKQLISLFRGGIVTPDGGLYIIKN